MAARKQKHHDNKTSEFRLYLPRILKYMAEHGPDTISGTKNGVRGDYKNVHQNLRKAEKLRMLAKMDKNADGYPEYWLTGRGALFALGVGADPEKLREWAKTIGLDDDFVAFETDFAKEVGTDRFRTIMAAFYQYDKSFAGGDSLATWLLAPGLQESIPIQEEDMKIFFEVVRRHPEVRQMLLKGIDDIRSRLGSSAR